MPRNDMVSTRKGTALIPRVAMGIGMALGAAFMPAHAQVPALPADAASTLPGQPGLVARRPPGPKLRLSVTFNEPISGGNARIAGLAVCSSSACVNVPAAASVPITNTQDGRSETIAEVESPLGEITRIHFNGTGQGSLQGGIALPAVATLSPDFVGLDILVVAQRRGQVFTPVAAAFNHLPREGTSVYYNPAFSSQVALPLRVKLLLPAHALPAPQVFIAGVHDTGDALPLVDLFPMLSLSRPAYLELTRIVRAAPGPHDPPRTPRLALPGSVEPPADMRAPVKVRIDTTGVVQSGT